MASPEHHFNTTGPPHIELQDIRPNPPSRQPTLEAQDHTPRAKQARKGFSRTIRTALSTSPDRQPGVHEHDLLVACEWQPKSLQFWHDYFYLRYRPRAPVTSLFHLIVKLIVQPPHGLDTIECYPGDEICLSDWLESVHAALSARSPDSLILW